MSITMPIPKNNIVRMYGNHNTNFNPKLLNIDLTNRHTGLNTSDNQRNKMKRMLLPRMTRIIAVFFWPTCCIVTLCNFIDDNF